jgi:hypothetical protein
MRAVIVRYRVKPEMAAENERLVRAVYAELQAVKPAGLSYNTHKLPDGVSFVHVAMYGDGVLESPLPGLATFKAFTADIKARCDELPVTQELQPIGFFSSLG